MPERHLELTTGRMCWVPAGQFCMGSDSTLSRSCERPSHRVAVRAYYIDEKPVTNALFARFTAETGYRTTAEILNKVEIFFDNRWQFKSGVSWRSPEGPSSHVHDRSDHPVVFVTLGDAFAFCEWRAKVEKRTFRLPTEAEWEKAARGTDGRTYPWGEDDVERGGVSRATFNAGARKGTTPVDAHPQGVSPYGVWDLAGNVWEWCLDAFDERYYQKCKIGAVRVDRGGPFSLNGESVFKGGSWIFPRDALRASGRHANNIVRASPGIGFRTVCPVDDSLEIKAKTQTRRLAFQLHFFRQRLKQFRQRVDPFVGPS